MAYLCQDVTQCLLILMQELKLPVVICEHREDED
jgi:hypothetical protein